MPADSHEIRGDKVVPYSAGRMNTDTDSWRDATDLEIRQHKEIEELTRKIDKTIEVLSELLDANVLNSFWSDRIRELIKSIFII